MQADVLSYGRKRCRVFDAGAHAGDGRSRTTDGGRENRFPRTLREWYGVDVGDLAPAERDRIHKALTVVPKHFGVGRPPEPYELTLETVEPLVLNSSEGDDGDTRSAANVLWVPRFFGLRTFGFPERSERVVGSPMDVPFVGTLGDSQRVAFDATVRQLHDTGGAVLVRKPGGGKTVVGIGIACRLGRRTLVVCHTSALVTQWEERIRQFAPEARIGRIQQKRAHVDADFVVAMMQSLCLRDYGPTILDEFGMTIMDEAHHVPAKTYMTITKKLKSHFLLALTATPDRKDGLQRLLHYGFGEVSHEDPGDAMEPITVYSVSYERGSTQMRYNRQGVLDMPNMITDLARDTKRTAEIASHLRRMYGDGRTCIVLSDRICLLDDLCALLQQAPPVSCTSGESAAAVPAVDIAYFVGSRTTEADRELAKTRRVILATFHEAREGLDIPKLDGAIFATPISDARQAAGRIQRPSKEKMPPVLYDVVDATLPCFANMAKKRNAWYRRSGFQVLSPPDGVSPR
jgi:superfamily II DNA or RNA helicase